MDTLIQDRLTIGFNRYGHGVKVDDDTTKYGTITNSWIQMALEEYLDAAIYVVADYIRYHEPPREKDCPDDNKRILGFINNRDTIKSETHKAMLELITKLIFFIQK